MRILLPFFTVTFVLFGGVIAKTMARIVIGLTIVIAIMVARPASADVINIHQIFDLNSASTTADSIQQIANFSTPLQVSVGDKINFDFDFINGAIQVPGL